MIAISLTGPAGLTYDGEIIPDAPIVVNKEDGLVFIMRTTILIALEATLCDDSTGVFQKSTVLTARTIRPMLSCRQAFGSFSQPYLIPVKFYESFSDSSALTERRVKLVLGRDCTGRVSSRPLRVIGKLT